MAWRHEAFGVCLHRYGSGRSALLTGLRQAQLASQRLEVATQFG